MWDKNELRSGLRLSEYTESARRFVWNELADWYLESTKGRLAAGGDKAKDTPTADPKTAGKPAGMAAPAPAAPAMPAIKAADQTAPAPATGAAPGTAPPEPPKSGGGGWRDMSDEQKAELRKKMDGMTDEQKAEFRKKMRERAQQSVQQNAQ